MTGGVLVRGGRAVIPPAPPALLADMPPQRAGCLPVLGVLVNACPAHYIAARIPQPRRAWGRGGGGQAPWPLALVLEVITRAVDIKALAARFSYTRQRGAKKAEERAKQAAAAAEACELYSGAGRQACNICRHVSHPLPFSPPIFSTRQSSTPYSRR